MAPIPLSCTGWLAAFFTCLIKCFSSEKKIKKNDAFAGYQFRGLGKFLAWLEQMVLASPLLSKFWLENSNLIWVDSM
jgi:succinate-acetate transporter protein